MPSRNLDAFQRVEFRVARSRRPATWGETCDGTNRPAHLPQRPTKEAGEKWLKPIPPALFLQPLPRSVAATDVGHTPIVSADSYVAATGIAVVSVPTMVPIPPVVTIPITTDTRRTDAELAARKHNWLIGRTHRARKRRQGRETARKHQD